jgi:hypothetical protein
VQPLCSLCLRGENGGKIPHHRDTENTENTEVAQRFGIRHYPFLIHTTECCQVQKQKPFGTPQSSTLFFLLTRFIDGLQLRRAISFQAVGKKLLEKHAIALSAARLCPYTLYNFILMLPCGLSVTEASGSITRSSANRKRYFCATVAIIN